MIGDRSRTERGTMRVRRSAAGSENLDPGAQLDLPGPGAAVLAVQLQIGLGDRIGIEHPVGAALIGARVARAADAAVDDDMPDMDVERLQFAREALCEA